MFLLDELPDFKTMKGFSKKFPEMEIKTTSACLRILKVASVLLRELEKHFSQHGISQARFLVLIVLERNQKKELMPVEISRQMGITKKNTARLLEFMENDGLIKRTSHELDGRATIVKITAKGSKLLGDVLPTYYEIMNKTMEPISEKSKDFLIKILDQVSTEF